MEGEEHLRWVLATLHSIGDGVVATDAEWRVRFINPVAEELTGWMADEAIGRELHEVLRVTISTPQPLRTPLGSLRGGTAQGRLIRRDRSELSIEETSSPIRAEGKVIGAVITIRAAR
jgi:PAS domain S-box-containing protein